jgi:hypothetical protein
MGGNMLEFEDHRIVDSDDPTVGRRLRHRLAVGQISDLNEADSPVRVVQGRYNDLLARVSDENVDVRSCAMRAVYLATAIHQSKT